MTTLTQPALAHFKLGNSLTYKLYSPKTGKTLMLTKGQVVAATTPADLEFYRSRRDVLVECNSAGVEIGQIGLVNGFDPKKAKSFAVYGRAPNPQAVVQSPQGPAPRSLPAPAIQAVAHVVQVGNVSARQVGRSPFADLKPENPQRAMLPLTGRESPVEFLSPDGKTTTSIAVA